MSANCVKIAVLFSPTVIALYWAHNTADSSIGRAEDCSRFRLLSSGRWFDSGSADSFLMSSYDIKKGTTMLR